MKKFYLLSSIILLLSSFHLISCKKYLEEKSDKSLSIPSTLNDLQAILDNYLIVNSALKLTNTMTDEYFVSFTDWQALSQENKDHYTWESNATLNVLNFDWGKQYNIIFYANTVLDNLKKITEGDQSKKDQITGTALFFRSHCLYQLAQLYCNQYDSSTAKSSMGLPLRLNSDFSEASIRATLNETYDQIISDLQQAIRLLPVDAGFKTRPNKVASYALLARVYLQMGNYLGAKLMCDSSLSLNNTLLDYKTLSQSAVNPFTVLNAEVIFYTSTIDALNSRSSARVDTIIYNSYATDDLRKVLYFEPGNATTQIFQGSYNGTRDDLFNGIANDEVYLIRAESNVRLGNLVDGVNDLNTLLEKRWKAGYVRYSPANASEVLAKILAERKKELLNRGTRWADIRRLNKESSTAITLKRLLGTPVYILQPNDLRYTMLIPQIVIDRAGIPQNPR